MQLIVTVHVKKCLQLTFMETHFSVLHWGGAAKFSTATEVKHVLRRWEKYSRLHREWKGVPDGLGVCRGGMADILDKGC